MKNGSSPRSSQAANRVTGGNAKAAPRAPNRYRWVTVSSKQSGSSPDEARSSLRHSTTPPKASDERPIIGPSRPDIPAPDADSPVESLDDDDDDVEELGPREMQLARPQRAIQAVSPQARLFFNHCKTFPS